MRKVKATLAGLHLLTGILALFGGWAAISVPTGPFGISTDMLAHSPFRTFFIPGLLLFGFIGLGQLIAAVFSFTRYRYQSYVSFCFAGILFIWIIVQVAMLRVVLALHVVTFLIACLQLTLSLLLMYQERLYPTDKVVHYLRQKKHISIK